MSVHGQRHPVLLAWLPTARTIPVVAPAALGSAAVGLMAVDALTRESGVPAGPMAVRVAMLLTATMVGWAFGDPSDAMVAPTPLGRARLRVIRALTAVVPWAVVLGVVVAMAAEPEGPSRYFLEGAALMTFALVLGAGAARFGSTEPGRVATGVMIPLVGIAMVVVPEDVLWGVPELAGASTRWWWALLTVGSVVAAVTVAGPDPIRSRAREPHDVRPAA